MKKYIPILLIATIACTSTQLSAFSIFSEVYEAPNLKAALIKNDKLKEQAEAEAV